MRPCADLSLRRERESGYALPHALIAHTFPLGVRQALTVGARRDQQYNLLGPWHSSGPIFWRRYEPVHCGRMQCGYSRPA
jgi:hypothetical protein